MKLLLPACHVSIALALGAPPAAAQLRPLDPVDWNMMRGGDAVSAWIGGGAFSDQHASLTGTRGTLLELGNFALGWKTGRVLLEASGTMVRRFTERERFGDGFEWVEGSDDGVRQDAGDIRVATAVRLSPSHWPALLGLRFGTRLPTTNNRIGLDRDQTDFFALAIARLERNAAGGVLAASVETGVSINGTRLATYEQADVLAYAAGAEYARPHLSLHAELVGHDDLHDWAVRGNEDLHELRLGARIGGERWLRIQVVRGLAEFSPGTGVLVAVGARIAR